MATSIQDVKQQMKAEDELLRYMQDIERGAHYKGLIKGRNEERENMVINGHNAGNSIETISAFTGLTPEQIKKVLKKHGLL
jgi:hypothetical protein